MIISTLLLSGLVTGLLLTAIAADTLVTNDTVNFRSGASLDAEVIMAISPGTSVEVLEHNPSGWSKVRVNGTTGYIKSEFLTIQAGTGSVTFRTIDGVNFRTSPSIDADIINTLYLGSVIEVVEHDPAGWSKVYVDGTYGYVKSEFIALPASSIVKEVSVSSQPSAQPVATLKTIDGVNFRSAPSLEADIIRTLDINMSVDVLERNSDGWAKIIVDGTVGYVRSDLLGETGRNVELLDWSVVRNLIQRGVPIPVIDVRTGLTYNIKCFSVGDHADVEPITRADTDMIFNIRNGVWSWAARPVWVRIGDHLIAASMHGMPHDVSTIPDNGMNGHLCLHFLGSTTTSSSVSYKMDLQNAVQEAWNAR